MGLDVMIQFSALIEQTPGAIPFFIKINKKRFFQGIEIILASSNCCLSLKFRFLTLNRNRYGAENGDVVRELNYLNIVTQRISNIVNIY